MIYTSRFQNPELKSGKYTVVDIVRGFPLFHLGYERAGNIIDIATTKEIFNIYDKEKFAGLQRKKGKHDDWIKGEGLKTICEWARYGLTDKQIIENIGIGRTTFYKWLREYPDFSEAIKKARVQINIEIENAMIDLACGKTYTFQSTPQFLD